MLLRLTDLAPNGLQGWIKQGKITNQGDSRVRVVVSTDC